MYGSYRIIGGTSHMLIRVWDKLVVHVLAIFMAQLAGTTYSWGYPLIITRAKTF